MSCNISYDILNYMLEIWTLTLGWDARFNADSSHPWWVHWQGIQGRSCSFCYRKFLITQSMYGALSWYLPGHYPDTALLFNITAKRLTALKYNQWQITLVIVSIMSTWKHSLSAKFAKELGPLQKGAFSDMLYKKYVFLMCLAPGWFMQSLKFYYCTLLF